MTNLNVTWLLKELEKNEAKSIALLAMIDSGCSFELLRVAIEELCNNSESLKLGCSIYEFPYCDNLINQ